MRTFPTPATPVASVDMNSFGSASMTGVLKRVLVRPPLPEDAASWRRYGWHAAPDPSAAAAEHEAFCLLLEAAGAEVVVSRHDPGNPDAIYAYDPVLVGAEGAVLLRPGKEGRRGEPAAVAPALEAAGVPLAAELGEEAFAEGGDTLWLDEKSLLVGIGYRTNEEALSALAAAFPGVDVVAFDLPHWDGAGEVMHLMSFISPLDRDLALGPRRALALEGNTETRRRMERAGVDVVTYRGDEISRKGDGGPTCLTRPLLRATS